MGTNGQAVAPWLMRLTVLTVAPVLVLPVASCGLVESELADTESGAVDGEGDGSNGTSGTDGGASVQTRPVTGASGEVEANLSLHRLGEEHLVAEFQVVNGTNERGSLRGALSLPFGDSSAFPDDYFSGIGWIDPEAEQLQVPYHTPDRGCLCSDVSDRDDYRIAAGDTLTVGAVLPAPSGDVSELTVFTSLTVPFVNVPVSDEEPDLDLLGVEHPDDVPDAEADTLRLEPTVERAARGESDEDAAEEEGSEEDGPPEDGAPEDEGPTEEEPADESGTASAAGTDGAAAAQPVDSAGELDGLEPQEITGESGTDTISGEVRPTELHRVGPELAVLAYEVTNTTDEEIRPERLFRHVGRGDTDSDMEGAALLDESSDSLYRETHLFVDEHGSGAECVCSNPPERLNVSESETYYNLMSIGADVSTVDVGLGDSATFPEVPVNG